MNDRELIRSFEGVHDKRFLAFAALAVLAFSIVVGGVVLGFRRNHVREGADAMSLVQSSQPRAPAPPPLAPVR
jgi:hypothetical protein